MQNTKYFKCISNTVFQLLVFQLLRHCYRATCSVAGPSSCNNLPSDWHVLLARNCIYSYTLLQASENVSLSQKLGWERLCVDYLGDELYKFSKWIGAWNRKLTIGLNHEVLKFFNCCNIRRIRLHTVCDLFSSKSTLAMHKHQRC